MNHDGPSLLDVEHLSCGYGPIEVLHDVSFRVSRGSCLCVLGANGCGKTTLLRAIDRLLPHAGSVRVDGRDLASMSSRAVARSIALLSQMSSVYFPYTVYETVMMGRYAHMDGIVSEASPRDREAVLSALERTGTSELRDRLVTELSGGQLQRVFLARTFAQDPRVILLDEPTNHLDLTYQVQLVRDLREWASEGERCVVGVLHDVNLALDLADSVMLMEDGRVLETCEVAAIDPDALNRIYRMDVGAHMRRSLSRWKDIS